MRIALGQILADQSVLVHDHVLPIVHACTAPGAPGYEYLLEPGIELWYGREWDVSRLSGDDSDRGQISPLRTALRS